MSTDERDNVLIDLRSVEATIGEDPADHTLSLVLDDGDTSAELVTGTSGDWSTEAIDNLEKLAETAGRLAALLRVRRGDRQVLLALAEAAPDVPDTAHTWSVPPANGTT